MWPWRHAVCRQQPITSIKVTELTPFGSLHNIHRGCFPVAQPHGRKGDLGNVPGAPCGGEAALFNGTSNGKYIKSSIYMSYQILLLLDRHRTRIDSLRSSHMAAADIGKPTQPREPSTTFVTRSRALAEAFREDSATGKRVPFMLYGHSAVVTDRLRVVHA